jgi:heptaprenyl diphosphate synthase
MTLTSKMTFFSLLFAFMVVLHMLDLYFSIPMGGYLLKIGLSNLIIVFVLFHYGVSSAIIMALLKIMTLSLFEPRYTAFTTIISISGTFLSLLGMIITKKASKSNVLLTSAVGGLLHNAGQWIAVWLIMRLTLLLYYLPLLIISGSVSGIVIGLISIKMLDKLYFIKKNHRY